MNDSHTDSKNRTPNDATAEWRTATLAWTPGGEPLAALVVDGDALRALARDDLGDADALAFRVSDDGALEVRPADEGRGPA